MWDNLSHLRAIIWRICCFLSIPMIVLGLIYFFKEMSEMSDAANINAKIIGVLVNCGDSSNFSSCNLDERKIWNARLVCNGDITRRQAKMVCKDGIPFKVKGWDLISDWICKNGELRECSDIATDLGRESPRLCQMLHDAEVEIDCHGTR
ncbi:MAG: hypothetical protein Q4G22_08325 [Paracoccus sp. (in: a-proteobacteria)]|nr:hypothetical protein [Paracoccus sp. (in: a-proteobacteria)]